MNIRKILSVSFIVFILGTMCHAQDWPEVTLGPPVKVGKRWTLSSLPGYDESGYYALKSKIGSFSRFSMEHYDRNLGFTKESEFELETDKKPRNLELFFQDGDKINILSSFYNQKQKKKYLFVESLDKGGLTPKGDLEMIMQSDYASRYNTGDFRFSLSRDSTYIGVFNTLPYSKQDPERFMFGVYNQKFEKQWEKTVVVPYKDKLFRIVAPIVDESGNYYILGKRYFDKIKSVRHGEPNFEYRLLAYYKDGRPMKEFTIKHNEKVFTDMLISVQDNGDIVATGFYSNKKTYSIDGTYYVIIDGNTGEFKSESFKEFGLDFINQALSERAKKKNARKEAKGKQVEMYHYDLDRLATDGKGGAFLIAEQFHITVYTSTNASSGVTTTHTRYHYGSVIIVHVGKDGQIKWHAKIPKYQVSTDDGGFFSSYATHWRKKDGKFYILYTDNPKKERNAGVEGIANYAASKRTMAVFLAEVTYDGDIRRKVLFSNREEETVLRPKSCVQISDEEMIIFGQRKKEHRLGKLTFK